MNTREEVLAWLSGELVELLEVEAGSITPQATLAELDVDLGRRRKLNRESSR